MSTDDGIRLLATRYVPSGAGRGPVVLIRTPYGRDDQTFSRLLARPLAARGYQVIVQSVRGTFGSTGRFEPGRHERADGIATVAWIRAQPWCDGRVATTGGSYLGTTQWALAPYLDEPLSAMSVGIGSSTMLGGWYPQGALGLDQTLRWASLIAGQEKQFAALNVLRSRPKITRALAAADFHNADVEAIGAASPIFRAIVEHADDPQYWSGTMDHSAARAQLRTPTSMVTGWFDLFLRDQLEDHQALAAAGRTSRITIGPWTHSSTSFLPYQARDAIELFDHTLRGRPLLRVAPVRLFIQGSNEWRDFASWPPPSQPVQLILGVDSAASIAVTAPAGGRKTIVYEPADPTPATGGPGLNVLTGQQDQRAIEARRDVLIHTTERLDAALEIIGTATARVTVSTSDPSALVVVRVCDVDERGVSRNVTEGLARIQPSACTESLMLDIALDPTAYVFRRGHRIRVHIAAGAYPRVVDQRGGSYQLTIHYGQEASPQLMLPRTNAA